MSVNSIKLPENSTYEESIQAFKEILLGSGLSEATTEDLANKLLSGAAGLLSVRVVSAIGEEGNAKVSAIADETARQAELEKLYLQKTGVTVAATCDTMIRTYVESF